MIRPLLSLLALGLAAAGAARAEVLVERTYLPLDANPSSFAVGLPGGVNFCFDPTRGGVSYAWTGAFIDVTPARPGAGKYNNAVKLNGPVVYRETGFAPLRRGDATRVPTVEFKGYTVRDDAIEFRYAVDGVLVREEVRAATDRRGLVRRFHVADAADAKWWYVTEGKAPTALAPAGAQTLTLEIPFASATP